MKNDVRPVSILAPFVILEGAEAILSTVDVRVFADFPATKLPGGIGKEIAPGFHLVLSQVQGVQIPLGNHP